MHPKTASMHSQEHLNASPVGASPGDPEDSLSLSGFFLFAERERETMPMHTVVNDFHTSTQPNLLQTRNFWTLDA